MLLVYVEPQTPNKSCDVIELSGGLFLLSMLTRRFLACIYIWQMGSASHTRMTVPNTMLNAGGGFSLSPS